MRRLLLLGAALAALLLAACGGEEEARPVTLMLNWTPNNHHAGIYAALQQGWYEEEGIELTIIEPAPPEPTPSSAPARRTSGSRRLRACCPRASAAPTWSRSPRCCPTTTRA